ncbi:MAG: M56 family metallopeptidase, partial [Acidobacteria bacterium]|nr:M56 family metallopeptidase [Acidobacteriota bacterium]
MTAELLAQNVAAHWMQAAGVAAAAWLAISLLRLREPGFLLKYWQAVLLLLLLAPWIQPWQPVASTPAHGPPPAAPAQEAAGVPGVSVAESAVALPADRGGVDPWTWVLTLLAAVAAFRLARLGLGLVRLDRLARSANRVVPPPPAREFQALRRTSAAFVQPPDVRMPCSFGLFRPTVVLPAAFDRLEPAFQRGIVCHELLHLERRDFAAAVAEEVAAALLWFHPWAWLIRGRIRLHREQVVDAAVVRRTGDRRAYVRCLIALAGHPRALPLAAPMLRPTELRARADALFAKDGTMSRRASAALVIGLGAALAAVLWTAAATVPLSAAAPPGAAARGPE